MRRRFHPNDSSPNCAFPPPPQDPIPATTAQVRPRGDSVGGSTRQRRRRRRRQPLRDASYLVLALWKEAKFLHVFVRSGNRKEMYGEPSKHGNLGSILQDQSSEPNAVSLIFLKEITNNFSHERVLGKGGSGVVYKVRLNHAHLLFQRLTTTDVKQGVLQSGEIIAVKRFGPSMASSRTLFENEVDHLMRLKHPNIVRFRGYCHETQWIYTEYQGRKVFAEISEMLICFEYIPKGSLDRHLSGGSSEFDWHTRYKIIEGICNGLHHLHEQIDKSILHLDLKPANVLLDDNLAPKITDLGLSRQFDQRQTISTPNRFGTLGYMAPELIDEGIITPKSDIFSLGVTILEIIMGHRHYPGVSGTSSEDFIELELKKWRNRLEKAQGYTNLEIDCEQIKRCIQIGLICVNPEWTERPTTTKIIKMLQGLESSDRTISNEVESSADQISNGLEKHSDYFGVTEEGKLSPKNKLCIEILEQAERREPEPGEASVSLAMAGDCLRGKLLYLETRVAFARIFFPAEARAAMELAQVDGTLEFTLGSSANPPLEIQRTTFDLNETPFKVKDAYLARMRALSKTVELGKHYFRSCSIVLDKIMEESVSMSMECIHSSSAICIPFH